MVVYLVVLVAWVVLSWLGLVFVAVPLTLLAVPAGLAIGVLLALIGYVRVYGGTEDKRILAGPAGAGSSGPRAPARSQWAPYPYWDDSWPSYLSRQIEFDIAAALLWPGRQVGAMWTHVWEAAKYGVASMVAVPPLIPPTVGFVVGVTVGTYAAWLVLGAAVEAVAVIPRLMRLAAIGVLRAADYLVQWWSGAAATCPDCRWITRLPAYWCSNDRCEAIHRDLRPGRLGVLWHRCRCGAPLSTTVWRASRTLTPACPACDHLLHDAAGVTPDARIALSGGPSAGKTQLLMWAMAAATVAGASPGMWEPADGPTAAWLRDSRDVLANWPDRRPPPTAAPSLLTFRSGSDRDRHYVHFTDIDGKCLLTDTAHPALRQLGTTRRHLLVFDATTFPIVRDKIDPAGLSPEPAESADATAMGIATASAELPYHLLVVQLNRFGARTRRCSLAIVLSRADLTIGDMSFKPDPVGPRSLQVRQWLRIIGMHNLVETAERDFGEVRYFLAGYGIESADPFAPFAWLLNRYSRGPSIP